MKCQIAPARRPLLAVLLIVTACSTVPLTGRTQFNVIPDSEMNAMSLQAYEQVLAESTLSSDPQATAMVQRVGVRIQGAVERYFQQIGEPNRLDGYQWEFNLIVSDEVNAWCMPGGRVAFYTGILPVCRDETGVAVVMGHEIAHAIARHGGERMSAVGGAAPPEFMSTHPSGATRIRQLNEWMPEALGDYKP